MFKKWANVFMILSLVFAVCSPTSYAAAKTVKVTVTLVSAELVENNSVGNEWAIGASVNGKDLEEGSSVTLNLKSTGTLKLEAIAEEQDKIPDYGDKSANVKLSSFSKSTNKTLSVVVTENRGRYSGNTATWAFKFKISKK
ncbi:hypothetical protein C161_08508 [Paenibacillus sp. FSL R5-192]|uniref:hypothetical protein n=1 Tax=Paenibacillus sp. FSL R5-192 TaxID=1226754 RepID=UPI0003E27D36|nr:hypothetical protein [Paenibacillus sp. FSL R5-192]ETT36539.1 hypothetical protein C161_08508 [Paenibacillus sp. FSL R5-192]